MITKQLKYKLYILAVIFLILAALKTHAQNKTEYIPEINSSETKILLQKIKKNIKVFPDSSLLDLNKLFSSINDSLNKYFIQAEYLKGQLFYYKRKHDSAIFFFKKVLQNPQKLENDTTEVKALNYIGLCYLNMGQYDKAIKYFQKSIEKSEQYNLNYRKAAALNNISLIYDELGLYDKSIYTLAKSLTIFYKQKDTLSIIKIYNNLGLLYQEMKEYNLAEEYFIKTLALSNKIQNIGTKSSAYINLGYLYSELNKNNKAIEYFKKALPLLKLTSDNEKIGENYIFLGDVYLNIKEYDKALINYDKAYEIYKESGSVELKIKTVNNLAKIYIIKNNFKKAKIYIEEARELMNSNIDKSLYEDIYKTISFYYEKRNDYPKAFKYYKKYSILKDSLIQKKFSKEVAKQKVLFENNLQQKKIKSLNFENKTNKIIQEHQSERIRNITWIIIAAFIIILLIILLSIYIFRQLRIKNKLFDAIKKNQKKLLEKNYEIIQQNEEIKSQTEQLYQINDDLMQLKTAIDETDNAVVILDKYGNFEWGNKGFDELYDINFNEFIKKYPNILDASKKSSNYVEMARVIKNTIENKTSGNYEFSTLNKKGKKIWIKTNIKAITDIKGDIQNIIVIDTDITDKVETSRLLEIKNHELEKKSEEINSSLRYAKTIQNAILPTPGNMKLKNNLFLIYLPKDIVSGDFYWFSAKENPRYNFYAVVDCTGHGVPGAFMSMIGVRLLSYLVNEKNINLPSEILEQMNISVKLALQQKLSGNKDGMDISLIRLENTPDNKTKIIFSGAKQSLFIYSKKDNKINKIRGDIKTIGGYFDDDIPFTNKKFTCEKGDIIYLLSDGIIDQNSVNGKKIGTSGFKNILSEIAELPLKEQKESIIEILNKHKKNTNQRDDITILGIKIE